MSKFHGALLLLAACAEARNIAITSDGVAVATTARAGRSLVTYDAATQTETTHNFPSSSLPRNVGGFDDVAVDPSALASDSTTVFALDANSGRVCSFDLSMNDGVSLDLIGCTTQSVRTSPFAGIAAVGGTLVVSGGTGGPSMFTYDQGTGVLSGRSTIRNANFIDIGYPDVTLVTPQVAAFSTDLARGFGVVVSSIDLDAQSISRDREFPIEDSVGFDFLVEPANFPLTTSVYSQSGTNYLYAANGGITVQDPLTDGEPTVVEASPNGFRALTVDVNSEQSVAVFGGVLEGRRRSRPAYVVLDISDPLNPEFLGGGTMRRSRNGRITGVASAGQDVLWVMEDSTTIGRAQLPTRDRGEAFTSFA